MLFKAYITILLAIALCAVHLNWALAAKAHDHTEPTTQSKDQNHTELAAQGKDHNHTDTDAHGKGGNHTDSTVTCHLRQGPDKVKWIDERHHTSGHLGISPKGRVELHTLRDHPAMLTFWPCQSKYMGVTQSGGFLAGHIRTLGKCLVVRSDALQLDKCPHKDDRSQTHATFGLFTKDGSLSAAAGDNVKVAGRKGIKLYLG